MATLLAAALDDFAAVFRLHALSEAVLLVPLAIVGAVGDAHGFSFRRDSILTGGGGACQAATSLKRSFDIPGERCYSNLD
jgi:hypothetical protein